MVNRSPVPSDRTHRPPPAPPPPSFPPISNALKEIGDDILAEAEDTLQTARNMLPQCLSANLKDLKDMKTVGIEDIPSVVDILREFDVEIVCALLGKHPPRENNLTVSLMLLSAFHRFIEKVAKYVKNSCGRDPEGMEPLHDWHRTRFQKAEAVADKAQDKDKKVKQNKHKDGDEGVEENGLFGDGSDDSELRNMGFRTNSTVYNRHMAKVKCADGTTDCPTGDFILKGIEDGGEGVGKVAVVQEVKGKTRFNVKLDVFKSMFANGEWRRSGFDFPLPNPEATIMTTGSMEAYARLGAVMDALGQASLIVRKEYFNPAFLGPCTIVAPKTRVYAHDDCEPGAIVIVPETNIPVVYKSKQEWDKLVADSGTPDPTKCVDARIEGDTGAYLIYPPKKQDDKPSVPFFNLQSTTVSAHANVELRYVTVNVVRDVAWEEGQQPQSKYGASPTDPKKCTLAPATVATGAAASAAPATGATGAAAPKPPTRTAVAHARAGKADRVRIPMWVNTKFIGKGDELIYHKEPFTQIKDRKRREKETSDKIEAKRMKAGAARSKS